MKLLVSSAPHISAKDTTASIMQKVIIATIPAIIASVVIFGIQALVLTAVTVASCVAFEYLYEKMLNKPITISDCSAVVTGILLAFNFPSTLPLPMAIVGSLVAIVVVKQLFGGIGFNFANPAIVGRIVIGLSFTSYMTKWVFPASISGDVVATATPLAAYKAGTVPPVMDMLVGTTGGVLGETSAIALLIGFVYLVATKVISPVVPVTYVGTVAIFAAALGKDPVVYVLGGGLLLGAIFMATDYTTSPYTTKGKIIFGLGLGFITVMIRAFGSMTEGVSFAILLMNLVVPYINQATRQKPLDGTTDKSTSKFIAFLAVIVIVPCIFIGMNMAKSAGALTGSAKGFGGDVVATVALDDAGAISEVTFTAAGETEGLGTKICDEEFTSLFVGQTSADAVDTIAGATISSQAAIDAVNAALASN